MASQIIKLENVSLKQHFAINGEQRGAVLYLHGFPGPVPESPNPLDQIESVLTKVSTSNQFDFFSFRYPGLADNPGDLTFPSTLACAEEIYQKMLDRGYQVINIVGHSWGGFNALCLRATFDRLVPGKLLLLAPFVQISYASDCDIAVGAFSLKQALPITLANYEEPQMVKDLLAIRDKYSPEVIFGKTDSTNTRVVLAAYDDNVPTNVCAPIFINKEINPIILSTDHNFSETKLLYEVLSNAFTDFFI